MNLNPSLALPIAKVTWRDRLVSIKNLLPWLGMIVLVLGVIYAGIMTPTESAALGAVLSIALAAAYRRMSGTALKESMWTAVRISSMCAFILFAATVMGQVFQQLGVIERFSSALLGLPFGKYGILAIIGLMYLIAGMFIEDWSLLLMTIPFVLPVVSGLGFSPIWFGVWYITVGEVGLITPPFGFNLLVLRSVVPKHDLMTIAAGAAPFIPAALVVATLVVVFPDLALWLPRVLY